MAPSLTVQVLAFYCPVFGAAPTGHELAHNEEKAELGRERVRLWYVASTRARELLVLPRLDVATRKSAWLSFVDLALSSLTCSRPGASRGPRWTRTTLRRRTSRRARPSPPRRPRSRSASGSIVWRAPSRDEDTAQPVLREEAPTILATDGDGAPADGTAVAKIQDGRERGTILHKLIEEVLTGETAETLPALTARAEILIRALGLPVMDDPALGLAPAELASCVVRTLSLPEVAALRPGLVPELPVYGSIATDRHEEASAGIVDAIAFDTDGNPDVVIDWKSDVDPSLETLEHYRAQVRAYLDMTGADLGLIVAVTTGAIMEVT